MGLSGECSLGQVLPMNRRNPWHQAVTFFMQPNQSVGSSRFQAQDKKVRHLCVGENITDFLRA